MAWARLLRWSGFGLMALSAVLFGAFIVGETFGDPGGWTAVGLVGTGLRDPDQFHHGRAVPAVRVGIEIRIASTEPRRWAIWCRTRKMGRSLS